MWSLCQSPDRSGISTPARVRTRRCRARIEKRGRRGLVTETLTQALPDSARGWQAFLNRQVTENHVTRHPSPVTFPGANPCNPMSGKPTVATVPPTHSPVKLRLSESSLGKRQPRHQRVVHTDGCTSESEDSGRRLKAMLRRVLVVYKACSEFHP